MMEVLRPAQARTLRRSWKPYLAAIMPLFDLPLEHLATYHPNEQAPADFDAFWSTTLAETAAFPLDPTFVPVEDPIYQMVQVQDVTFRGYRGQPVRGWFIEPVGNRERLPCLVTYIGYGGGRSLPLDHLLPAVSGFAHLVMDTRGQGSVWSPGDTDDEALCGPQIPGFMTRGIRSRETYYYRRVFTDAVRAIAAAAAHPRVDAARIGVTGGSQGGGIAIAAAALARSQVRLLMPDVPFLCHYRRAVRLVDTMPYGEIGQFLKTHRGLADQAFQTLAYFDGMFFAERVTARSLFSVGLMDNICPPSTVYAAYNRISAPKEMAVYEFNNHEGGGPFQTQRRMGYARQHL